MSTLLSRDRVLLSRDRVLLNRDREGAVSLCLCNKHRHRFPLLLDHIANCSTNIVPVPQPPRASVPRPSLSPRAARANLVQSPACIRFEIVHDLFGFRFSVHYHVNMSAPHMCRQQGPMAMRTNPLDRIQYCGPPRLIVQQVRRLIHQVALVCHARRVRIKSPMSRNAVVPIHGTGLVAVQMRTIARERNQVRHVNSFYTATSNLKPRASASRAKFPTPSRSRLGKPQSPVGRERLRRLLCNTTNIFTGYWFG